MKLLKIRHILIFFAFLILFIVLFTIWNFYKQANNNSEITEKNPNKITQETLDPYVFKSAVAITTNLALRFEGVDSAVFFSEVFSAKELLANRGKAYDSFIKGNMLATKEYYSLLKSDFRSSLKNASNKEATLNSIINQLEIRYNAGKSASERITTQRAIFATTMEKLQAEIDAEKQKINREFKTADTEALSESIDRYLDLQEKYNYVRVYLVFADKFIAYYKVLNSYNQNLLNALKLNRDVIIKGSYVVIPNSGSEILKDYGLLYSEKEIRALKEQAQKQETEENKE